MSSTRRKNKSLFNQENLDCWTFDDEQSANRPPLEIVPAILPQSFTHLEQEVDFVKRAVHITAEYVQVDVVDGMFATTQTWPFNGVDADKWSLLKNHRIGLPDWEQVNIEIDLMVMDQLGVARDWISAGVSRVIGHLESFDRKYTDKMTLEDYTAMSQHPDYQMDLDKDELKTFLDFKNTDDVEVVLSINPSTKNEALYPFLEQLDGVQFMGNDKIGYHGVELNPAVLDKVRELRALKPDMPIGIDIGVSFETLEELAEAGVTRFSSGSAILKSKKPRQTIADMLHVVCGE